MLHAVLSHTWHGSSQASSQPTEPSNGPTPFDYTTPFEDFCTYATSKAIKALHRYTTQLARATKGSPPPLVLPLRNRQFSVPDPIAAKLWSKAEVMCSVLLVACQLTDTDAEWCSLPWLKAVTVPPEAQGSRIALWLYLCTHIQPRISVLEISAIYNDVRNLWILTISPLSVTLSPAAAARIATNEAAARGFPVNSPSQVEYWVGQVCGYCAAYVSQSTGASWYLRAYGSPMPGTPLVRHCSLGLCKRKVRLDGDTRQIALQHGTALQHSTAAWPLCMIPIHAGTCMRGDMHPFGAHTQACLLSGTLHA